MARNNKETLSQRKGRWQFNILFRLSNQCLVFGGIWGGDDNDDSNTCTRVLDSIISLNSRDLKMLDSILKFLFPEIYLPTCFPPQAVINTHSAETL